MLVYARFFVYMLIAVFKTSLDLAVPHHLPAKDAALLFMKRLLEYFSNSHSLSGSVWKALIMQIKTATSRQLDNCCQLPWPEGDSKKESRAFQLSAEKQ